MPLSNEAKLDIFNFPVVSYIERWPFHHDGFNNRDFVLDEQLKRYPGERGGGEIKEQLKEFGALSGLSSLYQSAHIRN
jgi:hypothetical protein